MDSACQLPPKNHQPTTLSYGSLIIYCCFFQLGHSWAGYYDYNTLDQNCIIGPHHQISNLFFINGFSGHGIQQSPAAGHAISELILDGKYNDIDLTRFGYERVLNNEPLAEVNVV